jgi:hypothetical protein
MQWKQSIKTNISSVNAGSCIAIDKADNCYMAGTTWFSDSAKNFLLMKYDAKGIEQWRRIIYPEEERIIIPITITIDKNEEAIVAGNIKNSNGSNDILLMKFSASGTLLWKINYDGSAHLNDGCTTVITDKAGNIYAGGFVSVSQSNMDLVILKYNGDGKMLWTKNYSTPQYDVANAFAVDDSCNIYVAGNVNNSMHSSDIIVLKCDSSGNLKWDYVYDGSARVIDFSTAIALDDSASVFVTGSCNHTVDHADIPLLKFSRNGKLMAENFYIEKRADCSARSIRTDKKKVLVCASANDYIKSSNWGVLLSYDKSCNEKRRSKTSAGINYNAASFLNQWLVCAGTKSIYPEGIATPYIEQKDSTMKNSFALTDSTVMGMTHLKQVLIKNNSIYYLGDDASGEAGTITLIKYSIPVPEEKKIRKPQLDQVKPR